MSSSEEEVFFDALEDDPEPRQRRRTSLHPLSNLLAPDKVACSSASIVSAQDRLNYPKPVPIITSKGTRRKGPTSLDGLQLIQELIIDDNQPVFALAFSRDGRFLAAGGQDKRIRIWRLLVEEALNERAQIDAEVLHPIPSELLGHEAEILDLSWSRAESLLLLSASMDRTVRLWQPNKSQCLAIFRHPEIVTCVSFNPRDDRVFVTGCLDHRVRLWSLEKRQVLAWYELSGTDSIITCLRYSQNSRVVACGTSDAQCILFDATSKSGISFHSQFKVCSRRGPRSAGEKISGIEHVEIGGQDYLLVTSNDSRLRMYSMRAGKQICKYVGGFRNTSGSQLCAHMTADFKSILMGSEDGTLVIFERGSMGKDERIEDWAGFKAFSTPITCSIIAPQEANSLLVGCGLRSPNPDATFSSLLIFAADLGGRIRVWERPCRN